MTLVNKKYIDYEKDSNMGVVLIPAPEKGKCINFLGFKDGKVQYKIVKVAKLNTR